MIGINNKYMEKLEVIQILKDELQLENEILMHNLEKKNQRIEELQEVEQTLENEKKEYDRLLKEYNKIIYSRSYKMIQKLKGIIKKGNN